MSWLKRHLQRFLADESGPTAVEYAIMLALIITVCLAAVSFLGSRTSGAFSNVVNQWDANTPS
ncbi:MAG TPA: Flp family type IVb pilin [Gemmatales bacterium]|nr:Flp family type IVb pilin [Gemmatales bacterium]HMP59062.1 Flp family type IVb pilin [Gemmatales bacterium]